MTQENFLEQQPQSFLGSDSEPKGIRVKVIGIGGAGISLVDGLTLDNFQGLEQLALDVDSRAINDAIAPDKLLIGRLIEGMVLVENFRSPASCGRKRSYTNQ